MFDAEGRLLFQFETLVDYQDKSKEFLALPEVYPDRFTQVQFNESKLICFRQNGKDKIVLTQEFLPRVVKYYHEAMYHAESAGRLSQTLKRHCYHRDMDAAVKNHIEQCTVCSKNKHGTRVYRETAPRDTSAMPLARSPL